MTKEIITTYLTEINIHILYIKILIIINFLFYITTFMNLYVPAGCQTERFFFLYYKRFPKPGYEYYQLCFYGNGTSNALIFVILLIIQNTITFTLINLKTKIWKQNA